MSAKSLGQRLLAWCACDITRTFRTHIGFVIAVDATPANIEEHMLISTVLSVVLLAIVFYLADLRCQEDDLLEVFCKNRLLFSYVANQTAQVGR